MASKRKRRPEIMNPGLKQLTPYEVKSMDKTMADCKAMWSKLFAMNKYKPRPKPRQ